MLIPASQSNVSINLSTVKPGATLLPGQFYSGRIVSTDGKPQLLVANQRVPLPEQTQLAPGQTVQVTVTQGKEGLRLELSVPQQTAPAASDANALGGLIANIAKALNIKTPGGQLQTLLPGNLPQSPAAITAFLRALLVPGSKSEDLAQLGTLLQQAVQAGAVPPEMLSQFQAALAAYLPDSDSNLQKHLSRPGQRNEARLAAALKNGTLPETVAAMRQELRSLVASLRGNAALRTWLTGQRLLKQFDGTTQRLTEQLGNDDLPALRGLDHKPYGFLEIPLPQESAFARLQVHWLAHGDSRTQRHGGTTLALDLETTNLGALWISFYHDTAQCRCTLRAEESSGHAALEAARDDLAETLRAAGYPGAHVTVTKWQGDRVAALNEFFAPVAGLDING